MVSFREAEHVHLLSISRLTDGEHAFMYVGSMMTVSFKNWSDALDLSDLPEKTRKRHRVIINWSRKRLRLTRSLCI